MDPAGTWRAGKLRIKVSGCMRSMTGAEAFCAVRSYLATAAKHHIGTLDAVTQAAAGTAWLPHHAIAIQARPPIQLRLNMLIRVVDNG